MRDAGSAAPSAIVLKTTAAVAAKNASWSRGSGYRAYTSFRRSVLARELFARWKGNGSRGLEQVGERDGIEREDAVDGHSRLSEPHLAGQWSVDRIVGDLRDVVEVDPGLVAEDARDLFGERDSRLIQSREVIGRTSLVDQIHAAGIRVDHRHRSDDAAQRPPLGVVLEHDEVVAGAVCAQGEGEELGGAAQRVSGGEAAGEEIADLRDGGCQRREQLGRVYRVDGCRRFPEAVGGSGRDIREARDRRDVECAARGAQRVERETGGRLRERFERSGGDVVDGGDHGRRRGELGSDPGEVLGGAPHRVGGEGTGCRSVGGQARDDLGGRGRIGEGVCEVLGCALCVSDMAVGQRAPDADPRRPRDAEDQDGTEDRGEHDAGRAFAAVAGA